METASQRPLFCISHGCIQSKIQFAYKAPHSAGRECDRLICAMYTPCSLTIIRVLRVPIPAFSALVSPWRSRRAWGRPSLSECSGRHLHGWDASERGRTHLDRAPNRSPAASALRDAGLRYLGDRRRVHGPGELLLWVNNGLPRPTPATSGVG